MSDTVTKIVADLNTAILEKSVASVVEITAKYKAADREKIRVQYRTTYSVDPNDHITKLFKSSDETTLLANCWEHLPSLRARYLAKALKGSCDHRALLDLVIMCTREEWTETTTAFTRLYKKNLNDEVSRATKLPPGYTLFYTVWIKFDQQLRRNVVGDSLKLKDAFEKKEEQIVFDIMATTVEDEYRAIVSEFEKIAGMTLIQAFSTLTTGPLYWALHTAHYRNLGLNNGVAYLIHHACTSDKKGDVARILRLTPLLYDKCLNAKNFYVEFQDMREDISKAFKEPLSTALKVLWRVADKP